MSRKHNKPQRGGSKPGTAAETLAHWQLADDGSLRAHAFDYLSFLLHAHYSECTVEIRRRNLKFFFRWCDERSLATPDDVDRPTVEAYQRYLFRYRKSTGEPLAVTTQLARLKAVQGYFSHLAKRYVLQHNPAGELQLPKKPRRLPRSVFTSEEVEIVMAQPDLASPEGLRDRAMLELFYSTGIRRMEIAALSIYDVDRSRGVLQIREGKGRKDRVVPVADRALRWIDKYLLEARPQLQFFDHETTLFLSATGKPLKLASITAFTGEYVRRAEVEKRGSCHLFRHTVETLMLENGADVRFVQQMLGHADLKTTQVYTHVSIKQLKTVHNLTHPTAISGRASKPPPEQMPPI